MKLVSLPELIHIELKSWSDILINNSQTFGHSSNKLRFCMSNVKDKLLTQEKGGGAWLSWAILHTIEYQ